MSFSIGGTDKGSIWKEHHILQEISGYLIFAIQMFWQVLILSYCDGHAVSIIWTCHQASLTCIINICIRWDKNLFHEYTKCLYFWSLCVWQCPRLFLHSGCCWGSCCSPTRRCWRCPWRGHTHFRTMIHLRTSGKRRQRLLSTLTQQYSGEDTTHELHFLSV